MACMLCIRYSGVTICHWHTWLCVSVTAPGSKASCGCRLEQFAERMNYSATLLCQRLDAVADSSTGQTIDMYPLLADLTMVSPWPLCQRLCSTGFWCRQITIALVLAAHVMLVLRCTLYSPALLHPVTTC